MIWGIISPTNGTTIDFMLSQRRNIPATTKCFARTQQIKGLPAKIVIDSCGGNYRQELGHLPNVQLGRAMERTSLKSRKSHQEWGGGS